MKIKSKISKLILANSVGVFGLMAALMLTPMSGANAEVGINLSLDILPVIGMTLNNCPGAPDADNTSLTLDADLPTADGKFVSNCQVISIETNAPGYSLFTRASNSHPDLDLGADTNALIYQNPLPVSLTAPPVVPATNNTIFAPDALANNTWGFAVASPNVDLSTSPAANFDSTYAVNDADGSYASLPITDTAIYSTNTFPGQQDTFDFYYAAKVNLRSLAGIYQTTVTYTAISNDVPATPTYCGTFDFECIMFTVDVGTTGTYSIPTSGLLNFEDHDYDWIVYVDDVLTADCTLGNCAGMGSISDPPGADGIVLTGLSDGTHQIKILPNGDPAPGWGNAFGHYEDGYGASDVTNKQKLISIDAPLTTMAFAPESGTSAMYMFAGTFLNCANLTTPATIINTYTLPNTITDLSGFMLSMHVGNPLLTNPVNLFGLADWLDSNTSITNLNYFLYNVHLGNSKLIAPINLTPLSGWFDGNNSIIDMDGFFGFTHSENSQLIAPLDLAPISDWFKGNTSISSMYNFFDNTHSENFQLTTPINLYELSGWFNPGRSFGDAEMFLRAIHADNFNLNLTGQIIFPNWAKTITQGATPLLGMSEFFSRTFYLSSAKSGDTGEPKFEDGSVVSSIGTPSSNRETYTNRTGISPVNSNWQ